MARFIVGQPIATVTPSITVDAGLRPGVHRFQLEVFDSSGRRSAPDVAVVTVRGVAVPTGPTGVTIPGPTGPGPEIRPEVVRPEVTLPDVVRPGGSMRPRITTKPRSPPRGSKPK
jgi:hypothetical protein